ncbi:glycosyltransferase family 4 protein [Ruicaihuangia caeni]|uniref:glycosyltransferase family 4 protein n=1 Tax=Ruicaihuangia caeni TaxID=3042517 RepID=UPI00338F58BD
MRLIVDCRYVRVGRHDGISRFTAGLVAALAKRHPLVMLISDERQLEKLPPLAWRKVSSPTSWREPFVALQVNRLRPDVVFTPMQTMGSLGRRYRLVSTLHDLIYYSNPMPPRNLPWFVRVLWRLYHLAWWPQRLLLNGADAVVTVSETTKRSMIEHRLTKRSITVVPNAADTAPDGAEQGSRRQPPANRDLVYMGSFMPYKNVEVLARALRLLPGYRLHLLSGITDVDRGHYEELAPAGALVFHDGVSDEEYDELLSRAFALVHASRDEGFGIPLVEAMTHGTPVVVSDIPIFREIAGDAGRYFDPDDAQGVASALRALEDDAAWLSASKSGTEQARLFDWERSAGILLELLQRVSSGETVRVGDRVERLGSIERGNAVSDASGRESR